MNNRRKSYMGLLFAVALIGLLLTGCRAFEPEAVVVNKRPETFIIGAPLEEGGGYYHFHVFWYGADEDGQVERFVWALTDTSLQDPDTVSDEEDENFNPALDASTLEIGRWTTRTDSIFNFTIDQGVTRSVDMTLHMVAVDDAGDFDRTPARLHFFSNTLGNPEIRFFRIISPDSSLALAPGQADTVGYGVPYHMAWTGTTPNLRGYSSDALALVDTVPPFDDGLFGYKWQIMGDLGGNCLASLKDCWHPRKFNEATGDSFSFFGPVTELVFENNDSGTGPFRELLPSGTVDVQVNSVDIAGVEVAEFQRPFAFVVNFDPETVVLNGETDWAHPEDTEIYPYYIRLNDVDPPVHHPFQNGDRIPDRTYVVVKALARDDARDLPRSGNTKPVGFTGFMQGTLHNFFGGVFRFVSESSELNFDPTWGPNADGWSADTLGFLTAPSTTFKISMQSVDEHGRRDGSPDTLSFDVGYPPVLQCVEVLPKTFSPSDWDDTLPPVDDPATHPCFQDTTELRVTSTGAGPDAVQFIQPIFILVDKQTYFVKLADSPVGQDQTNYVIDGKLYRMSVLLHGKDDPREAWADPLMRTGGWKYQVDYECDPFNQIADGGGNDDIRQATWGQQDSQGTGLKIDPASGLWRLTVDIAVPEDLFSGPDTYMLLLTFLQAGGDAEIAQEIFDATIRQFGNGTIQAITLDQAACGARPERPGTYTYFKGVRPPLAELPVGRSWRDCSLIIPDIKDDWSLTLGAMSSRDGEPVVKDFRIVVETDTGDFTCELP